MCIPTAMQFFRGVLISDNLSKDKINNVDLIS